jgi:hypothetical protein
MASIKTIPEQNKVSIHRGQWSSLQIGSVLLSIHFSESKPHKLLKLKQWPEIKRCSSITE